jgi:hypothetical protein
VQCVMKPSLVSIDDKAEGELTSGVKNLLNEL